MDLWNFMRNLSSLGEALRWLVKMNGVDMYLRRPCGRAIQVEAEDALVYNVQIGDRRHNVDQSTVGIFQVSD